MTAVSVERVEAGASAATHENIQPRVESWRVITEASGGRAPTADVTLRLRAGNGRHLIQGGEASSPEAAVEAALSAALDRIAGGHRPVNPETCERLRAECGLPRHARSADVSTRVLVSGVHRDALLARLAVLTNTHDVSGFCFNVADDGMRARAELQVHGEKHQATRLARKLRPVVGVTDVLVL